jgi:hypothetical protein
VVDVVRIFVAPISNMLHHNNVGITYLKNSDFRMEQQDLYHYILWQCLSLWS